MFKRRRKRGKGRIPPRLGCAGIIICALSIPILLILTPSEVWESVALTNTAEALTTDTPTATDSPTRTAQPTDTPSPTRDPNITPTARPVSGAASICYESFDWERCDEFRPAPSNCEESRARSIPPDVAACCFPDRDANKDGVACE